jgi:hypothetical protein
MIDRGFVRFGTSSWAYEGLRNQADRRTDPAQSRKAPSPVLTAMRD